MERTAKRLEFACLGHQSLSLHHVTQSQFPEAERSFPPRLIEKTSSRESTANLAVRPPIHSVSHHL